MQRDMEYMLDILEAAKLAIDYIGDKTREEFFGDLQCQDAVIRRLEIIERQRGESQKKHKLPIPTCHGATWSVCATS